METRDAFEARLKTMQGLEFVVAYDPLQAAAQSDTQFAHEPSNVWVIRKQTRQKRAGLEDEIIHSHHMVADQLYRRVGLCVAVNVDVDEAVTGSGGCAYLARVPGERH